jgi:hypothetical protein
VRRYTRQVAQLRADAGLASTLNDVYYVVVVTAVGLGMAWGLASALAVEPAAVAGPQWSARSSLAAVVVAALVGVAGAVLGLAARLGPVGLGGAEASWFLWLPVDRRSLLRPVAWRVPVLAGVAAGVATALLDGALLGDGDAGRVWRVTGTAAIAAAGLALGAGLAQARPGRAWAVQVGDAVLTAAPLVAAGLVAVGWQPAAAPDVPAAVPAALLAGVAALAWLLDARLGRIPAARVREGGSLGSQAAGALVSFDSRELGRVLTATVERPRRRRSLRLRHVAGPVVALVTADALVLQRSPRHLVQLLGAGLLPVLVLVTPALRGPVPLGLAVLVGGFLATLATAEPARRAEIAPALDRLLPIGARATRRVRLVVPGIVMAAWSGVTLGVVGSAGPAPWTWALLGVLTGPAWAGGAVRGAYRPAPDWSGPLVSTPAGALPTGVAGVLARGPDVLVLGLAPVLVALVVGSVPPVVLVLQAATSAAAAAWGASTSTRSIAERLWGETDRPSAALPSAGRPPVDRAERRGR